MAILKHKRYGFELFEDLEPGAKMRLMGSGSDGAPSASGPTQSAPAQSGPAVSGDNGAAQELSKLQAEKGDSAPQKVTKFDMEAGTQEHAGASKRSLGDKVKGAAHDVTDKYHELGDRIAGREYSIKDENGHTVKDENGKALKTSERSEFNAGRKGHYRGDADYKQTEEQLERGDYPWNNVEGRDVLNHKMKEEKQGEKELQKFNKQHPESPLYDADDVKAVKTIEAMKEAGVTPAVTGQVESSIGDSRMEKLAQKIDGRKFENLQERAKNTDITEPGSKYEETGKLYKEAQVNELTEGQTRINNMVNGDRERSPEFDKMLKDKEKNDPEAYQAYRENAQKSPQEVRANAEKTVDKNFVPEQGDDFGRKKEYLKDFTNAYGSKSKYDNLKENYQQRAEDSQGRVDWEQAKGSRPEKMDVRSIDMAEIHAAMAPMNKQLAGVSASESSVQQATRSSPSASPISAAPSQAAGIER